MSFHGASLPPIDLGLIDPTEEPLPAEGEPRAQAEDLHPDVRRGARPAGGDRRADLRHHRRHADRHRAVPLRERFPSRFFDVGIAEQHAVTMAAGLALAGMRPVVALYSTFSQRAYDQLVHDVCQNDAPVLLGLDRAGLVGEDGTSHQGMFTLPGQRALPNLVIGSPKDEQELRDLVVTALAHRRADRAALPPRRRRGPARPRRQALEIGRAEVLRGGDDLLLVGFGPIVQRLLPRCGESSRPTAWPATVINARWAKPLDEELIAEHAAGKRLVVTAEECAAMGGFGDGVLDALNRAGIRVPVLKVALAEGFVHHGAVEDLRRQQRIDVPGHPGPGPRGARRRGAPTHARLGRQARLDGRATVVRRLAA